MVAKQNIVTLEDASPPAEMLDYLSEHAGEGTSQSAEDNLVPLIYILQKQSPQVDKNDPKYISTAEPGDIWLRNAQNPVVKGDIGIIFQPCYFSIDWVEWVPRDKGGGFISRYSKVPEDATKMTDPTNPNKVRFVRPNGNEVVQTRYHVGYVIQKDGPPLAYVIPMTSSGHTISREWMFRMNQKTLKGGKAAPSYAALYSLKTRRRVNSSGTWFTWLIDDAGWVRKKEDAERGEALHKSFALGAQQADIEDHEPAPVRESEELPF